MTDADKLNRIKTLTGEMGKDALFTEYLNMAASEILAWMYSAYPSIPEDATVPVKYDQVQVSAVITAYTVKGAEGETTHIENGVHNYFKYEDMVSYIRNHVYPLVYLGAEE